MGFTVHGIVPPSCCMYFLRLPPWKYMQPSLTTYPIHCKNHETTITCTCTYIYDSTVTLFLIFLRTDFSAFSSTYRYIVHDVHCTCTQHTLSHNFIITTLPTIDNTAIICVHRLLVYGKGRNSHMHSGCSWWLIKANTTTAQTHLHGRTCIYKSQ